jgi:DNA replication protein DnaC
VRLAFGVSPPDGVLRREQQDQPPHLFPPTTYISCPICSPRIVREQKAMRLALLMVDSRVPVESAHWSFDTFPVTTQAKAEAVEACRLFAWGGVPGGICGLYLWGPYGTGKTSLAISILRVYLDGGETALFWKSEDLYSRITATFRKDAAETQADLIALFRSADLLVLDDLGAEKESAFRLGVLYAIVDSRLSNNMPTVFTSNLSLREMEEHIGARLVDRIDNKCHVQFVPPPNLRRTHWENQD